MPNWVKEFLHDHEHQIFIHSFVSESKYPELCSLCNAEDNTNCSYGTPGNHHEQALSCLIHGGDVAYVSLEDAHNYFFTVS